MSFIIVWLSKKEKEKMDGKNHDNSSTPLLNPDLKAYRDISSMASRVCNEADSRVIDTEFPGRVLLTTRALSLSLSVLFPAFQHLVSCVQMRL